MLLPSFLEFLLVGDAPSVLEINEAGVQITLSVLPEASVCDSSSFAWGNEVVGITDDSSISLDFAFTEDVQLALDAKGKLLVEIVCGPITEAC
jgi:hypothetical protein